MECDHCKNKFKTQSSLNYHKNNAKYCLQKRNQVNIDLVCNECKKTFSSKHWFNEHKNKCRVNIEKIKNSYDKIVQENNQLKTIYHISFLIIYSRLTFYIFLGKKLYFKFFILVSFP